MTSESELAIEPMVANFVKICPSTIVSICVEVLTQWIVCHCPSVSEGPAISSA
jgi:hypothetical protein